MGDPGSLRDQDRGTFAGREPTAPRPGRASPAASPGHPTAPPPAQARPGRTRPQPSPAAAQWPDGRVAGGRLRWLNPTAASVDVLTPADRARHDDLKSALADVNDLPGLLFDCHGPLPACAMA